MILFRCDLSRLQISELYMAFSGRLPPRRTLRSRGLPVLPGPAGSGRLDTVRRDLGGDGCLEKRGGTLVAGLHLRLYPRVRCGSRAACRLWAASAPEMGDVPQPCGPSFRRDVIFPQRLPLRLDSRGSVFLAIR